MAGLRAASVLVLTLEQLMLPKALSTQSQKKMRLSHKSATVAENGDTTAKSGDCRTLLRQCGQAITVLPH